jgi:hypothetical protein
MTDIIEEMSAFIALQSFLNRLRSPTVRMIFEKVKENGFAVVEEKGFVFVRSHATMRPSRLLLPAVEESLVSTAAVPW